MSPSSKLYYEDLKEGMSFRGAAAIQISREEIIRFAREYDPQSFHLSDQGGNESYFEELVASGWHTACITMRMLVEGELQCEGGLIGTSGEIVWTKPVRPGDSLSVQVEVSEKRIATSVAGYGFVTIKTVTVNQNHETVQRMSARLMVKMKSPTTKKTES